jgi:hypothetical protein
VISRRNACLIDNVGSVGIVYGGDTDEMHGH